MYYLQNLCLVCLKSNVTLKNINHVDSDNVSILDKLEYTTVLFSNEFHDTTLYICDECHINLNNTYAFKKLSTRNINYFKAYTHQLRTVSKNFKYLSVVLDKTSVKQILLDQCYSDSDDDEFKNEDIIDQNKSNKNADMFNIDTVCIKVEDVNENCTNQNQVERDIPGFENKEDNNANLERFPRQISNTDINVVENKLVNKISIGNHAKDKQFKCTICRKVFELRQHLREHIRTHTGEKPYKCHLCSKAFIGKGNLRSHIRTHTGEKPFKCHLCSKAFNLKQHLNTHVRTHTGEKPFKCHLCSKAFTQIHHLNNHIRTHTGEKPFKCHLCSKAFNRKEVLNNHVRTHTREKSFECHLCLKPFIQRHILTKHIKTHHATTLPNDNMDILENEVQNNIIVEDMNAKDTLLMQVEDIYIFKRDDMDIDSELFKKEISNGEVKQEV